MNKYLVVFGKDYDVDTKGIVFAENGLQARVFFKNMLVEKFGNYCRTIDINEFDVCNLNDENENCVLEF